MMQAVLSNAAYPEYGAVTLPFPIPREDFGHCIELLEALEIGKVSTQDCHVDEINSKWPILGRLEGTNVDLDELDYGVSVSAINQHLKTIFMDGELDNQAVIKKYLITASDGKQYHTNHYNLQAIIAVGFKVNNDRAVQFRKWANGIVKDYTIQGWAIDSDRLKNGGSVLTKQYFDHLLEQIREIRMSERRFYQKITDIYATALDYDRSSKTTRLFFAEVQNKLHWAIHRHTAAELIMERANAEKPHMGLTSWEQYPDGKIQKYDVSIAKNYLSKEELQALERIVTMYLDYAPAGISP